MSVCATPHAAQPKHTVWSRSIRTQISMTRSELVHRELANCKTSYAVVVLVFELHVQIDD